MKKTYDVVVIGGGPSGMAAALKAHQNGCETLIIEKDEKLGGILNQCIHNGFGLKYFNKELTGPEYAYHLALEVEKQNIDVSLNTFAYSASQNKVGILKEGQHSIVNAKAIVLSSGSRERTAGQINLAGSRPSGIYTAGTVQKMISFYNQKPGKKAVILGSGDIGLIMARRLTYEGVAVLKVFEIMKNTAGLKRNIVQCLDDFNIPLLTCHTITRVIGTDRVEGVFYAQVDENLQPLPNTEKFIECDCVILSVGLIPEMEIFDGQVEVSPKNKSFVVDENRESSLSGVFVSGNVLHIHDLADNATIEGEIAGISASKYAKGEITKLNKKIDIKFSDKISYTIPQKVNLNQNGNFKIYFRNKNQLLRKTIVVNCGEKTIAKKFSVALNSGELQEIDVKLDDVVNDLFVDIL
ncbi:MAG: FAD-dependent oxidoreductase [Clostridia bacterium]|jgi:sarcosine oxidase subunit alpha|nr:FAD-dependent oxidoreductase [Clostridia bacterium]MDD3862957.1 FAD-dependent oxidoreductase [Clostridia bacterium]MDD4408725.1 FAD-dependent oxidoreductase [Clostridia bacterium]